MCIDSTAASFAFFCGSFAKCKFVKNSNFSDVKFVGGGSCAFLRLSKSEEVAWYLCSKFLRLRSHILIFVESGANIRMFGP